MIPTPAEAAARLKEKSAFIAYGFFAAKLVWEFIDAASNIEYAIDKFPRLKAVTMPLLSGNLLILLGVLWLLFLVMRPGTWSLPWTKVGRLKELLRQAAEELRKHEGERLTFEGGQVHAAAARMVKVHTFVQMALGDEAMTRMIKYQDAEHRKHKEANEQFNPDAAMARYLQRLRSELKPSDVDPGFHFPDNFTQFLKQDGWIPNSVDQT